MKIYWKIYWQNGKAVILYNHKDKNFLSKQKQRNKHLIQDADVCGAEKQQKGLAVTSTWIGLEQKFNQKQISKFIRNQKIRYIGSRYKLSELGNIPRNENIKW